MREFRSYVALGDSFTEGVGDPAPDGAGLRGWADRFAAELAWHQPGLSYANLAIRGKLVSEVLAEQVPVAAAMAPDLVTLAAGGNDMLRPRTDPDVLAATFETAVAKLTTAGSTVLVFTGYDPMAFPVLRLIRGKAAVFGMHLRAIATKYDCLLADLWPMRALTDRRLWSSDRLHLSPDGHRRVALLACEVAGIPVVEDWRVPLMDQPVLPRLHTWMSRRWSDVEWVTEHAGPYLSRRLHGISSGDGRAPKRPSLLPVRPGDPAGPVLALAPAIAPVPVAPAVGVAQVAAASPVGVAQVAAATASVGAAVLTPAEPAPV
jgi:lysophospholipase L1-like esterase